MIIWPLQGKAPQQKSFPKAQNERFDLRLQLRCYLCGVLLSQERPSLKNYSLAKYQVGFLKCCTEVSNKEVVFVLGIVTLSMYLKSLQYRIPSSWFFCFLFLAWVCFLSKNKAVFVRVASSAYIHILEEFTENNPYWWLCAVPRLLQNCVLNKCFYDSCISAVSRGSAHMIPRPQSLTHTHTLGLITPCLKYLTYLVCVFVHSVYTDCPLCIICGLTHTHRHWINKYL